MPAKKTLFNEIFKEVMDFISDLSEVPFRPKNISDNSDNELYEETVRSWRSRGLMPSKTFQRLLTAMSKAVDDETKKLFCQKVEKLKKILNPIWNEYSVDMSHDDVTDSDGYDDIIKSFLTVAYNSAKAKQEQTMRVVAFDFDGALVKGIRHSWTVLWQAIGKTSEEATKHKAAFEAGKMSYTDWCKSDLEALRAGGLTMEMVKAAVKKYGCSLTKNLEEAVELLHKNNCKVVIISGGADCLLYALLPNAKEIFDDIYINQVIFGGPNGVISNIIPTKYDWDKECIGVYGKEAGFEMLCEKYGAKLEDSVFVGDDRNDFTAMKLAGMKILYHDFKGPDATRSSAIPKFITNGPHRGIPEDIIMIGDNDLMQVAQRIVDWNFDD